MALFVNKYNNSGVVERIKEVIKRSNAIYVVGSKNRSGYIAKFSLSGNIIWSKEIIISEPGLEQGITSATDTGQGIAICYKTSTFTTNINSAGVALLDYNGNIQWFKRVFYSENNPITQTYETRELIHSYINHYNNNIDLILIERVDIPGNTYFNKVLAYKLSMSGNLIVKKYHKATEFDFIGRIKFVNGYYYIQGEYSGSSKDGFLGEMDTGFARITKYKLSNTNTSISTTIHRITEVHNGKFLLLGTYNNPTTLFIARVNATNYTIELVKYFSSNINRIFSIRYYNGSVFLDHQTDGLFKFNSNLVFQWNKRLTEPVYGISKIENDEIITKLWDNGIGVTEIDYESCITETNLTSLTLNVDNNYSLTNDGIKSLETQSEILVNTNNTISNLTLSKEIICPSTGTQTVDLATSTIEAENSSIPADGTSTTAIIVRLLDGLGNPIITGNPYTINITTTAGTVLNSTGQTNNNGVYEGADLQSSTVEEVALLEFSVTGVGDGEDTDTVEFIQVGVTIPIDEDTELQSPHIYLQAAGSDGTDSTKGRHLRWAFRKALGEKHLPKGNNASTQVNFNKPNDFVSIYRAPYTKFVFVLDLSQETPVAVDHSNYLWIYRLGGKEFYAYFKNTSKYDEVLNTYDPLVNPFGFITNYGNEVIEIENKKELFFAVKFEISIGFIGAEPEPRVQFETLSVNENVHITNKVVSNRKEFQDSGLNNTWMVCENGRSVRFKTFDCTMKILRFEMYSDFISGINSTVGWQEMGDYALSLNNTTAYDQLEPSPGDVHGIWQRFNDDAFVNIDNYQDKWDGTPQLGDKTIKQVVNTYIQLSDNANNPTALEEIPLGNDPNDPNDIMEISNLDLLNFAANDYHVARLLGLGILDIDDPVDIEIETKEGTDTITTDLDPNYIYIAEYFTTADLEDGQGARDVHHLFMSLPTSNDDFRLPIPVDLNELIPGIFIGGSSGDPSPITDEDGYTHNGLSRYVSLYATQLPEDPYNDPFYSSTDEINLSLITNPVFGGLEHKIDNGEWDKPELSNDPEYQNEVSSGEPHNETRFILLPEALKPYYIHRQTNNGLHSYMAYGINWFSRSAVSDTIISIDTLFSPQNPLKPPTATNALLIRQEAPLLLTSEEEQDRLAAISGNDKTLIRLTYNYHTYHELKDYKIPIDSGLTNQDIINDETSIYPDDDEILAEEIEIFFRNEIPSNIIGKALSVEDHNTHEILSVIETGEYIIASTGESIIPVVSPGNEENFIGGVFVLENEKFIIHEVSQGTTGPIITVYKKQISDSIAGGGNPTNSGGYPIELPITGGNFPAIGNGVELISPEITGDGYFMALENMQTPSNWGTPNPLSFKVAIGDNTWSIIREVIEIDDGNGSTERHLEKSRGIWGDAEITPINEPSGSFQGMYKIEFSDVVLQQHSSFAANNISAEWFRGIARVYTNDAFATNPPNKTRKILSVLKMENVGSSNKLIIYVQDTNYDSNDPNYDSIQTGTNISVNYYPGYKVYLYEDNSFGINEENILPEEGEGMSYSIFGFRSSDTDENYLSKISTPALMFAQEIIEPLPPELPEGPLYATRPDFFGRSTYTLTTKYQHKPHGVLFYRSNDEALLNSLYEKSTILQIREELSELGGNNEEYVTNRWQNFLDFTELESEGDYNVYPPPAVSPDGYKFPNPDKQAFFDWANNILTNLGQPLITDNPGTLAVGDPKIISFVKGIIYNAFVPLTELPVIYQYINGENYKPQDKKQVVRDRNGSVLPPGDPNFEMAPMMKVIGESPQQDETLFTDFKLDGTSNNLYFYGVKELGTQLKLSEFSPFLGPIKLVNTNAPETPEIKRIIPVLANEVLGSDPKIQIEINAFPDVQNIKKITIYRAKSIIEAKSIHSMKMVKVIDLEQENLLEEAIWTVSDDFSDLSEIPFGDPLYYRITVSREVEYADKDGNIITDYAPSQASKIVASMIVEVSLPLSPTLKFLSTPPDGNDTIHSVSLQWNKTIYNGIYHIYSMNSQGNWYKIHQLKSNDEIVQVSLLDTDLNDDSLILIIDGVKKYYHFKVVAENTAGMLSTEENILTIFNEDDWIEI